MKKFLPYTQHLEALVRLADDSDEWKRKAISALDGEPGRVLSRSAPLRQRRRDGAFFTGSRLAEVALSSRHKPRVAGKFFDPTCGAGDLLVAGARRLPVLRSLRATLVSWSSQLAGQDLHPAFIRAAKARLVILALQRGARNSGSERLNLAKYFSNIRVGNAFEAAKEYTNAGWILINPPYGCKAAPSNCSWAHGKVTAAALFFEISLRRAREGTRITAILPEVLRSGTRYRRWREMVERAAVANRIESYGLFDEIADVDVFILDVTKRATKAAAPMPWGPSHPSSTAFKVHDYFEVHVGSVVPHRHKRIGEKVPYIHARAMPPWQTVAKIKEARKFNGTLFRAPFVALRRTSRPEDVNRATATLVVDPRAIAVENHLIVCAPRSGSVVECKKLLAQLRDSRTNDWFNSRIRCRHLTVSAVRELPWWSHK